MSRKSERKCPISPDHEVVVNDILREPFDYCKECGEDIDYLRKQQIEKVEEELENQDKDREHIVIDEVQYSSKSFYEVDQEKISEEMYKDFINRYFYPEDDND